jgi:adenine-specific DNA-methyltransferase
MNFFNDSIELRYEKETDLSKRKSLGQFFTPFEIAASMAKTLLKDTPQLKNKIIGDPASGLGVFQRAIVSLTRNDIKFVNYEIDSDLAGQQKKYLDEIGADFQIITKDYLSEPWEREKYDFVIANPPYIKHIRVSHKKNLHDMFNSKLNCRFPATTNYYCYFIFKALYELKDMGRAIFIVPGEFLNSNYGVSVKKYLLEEGSITKIMHFKNSEKIFRDVLTPPVIILFVKNRHATVEFITLSLRDNKLIENSSRLYNVHALDPGKKWKTYFNADRHTFKCLTSFGTYARAMRGVATGANEFFLLTEPERISRGISLRYVKKCIAKSDYVKWNSWGKVDFKLLKRSDKKVWLLFLNDYLPGSDPYIEKYIKYGVRKGFNKKHLPRNRKTWYHMEKGNVGDIWIGTFSRDKLKFIINEAKISNLTCFHSIIFKKPYKKYLYFFMGYFMSSVAKDVLSLDLREHGNGLFKLEPDDLSHSYLPRLDAFSPQEIHEIADSAKEAIIKNDIGKREKLNSLFRDRISGF